MRVASIPRSHTSTRHIGWPGDGVERIVAPAAQRRSIATAHVELYRRLVASGPGAASGGDREARAS